MEYLEVDRELCVGCGQCLLVCEFDAIKTEWGETEVNEDLCVLCSVCIEYCPVEALTLAQR